jgi:putative transposase
MRAAPKESLAAKKGSKNKNKAAVVLAPELVRIKKMVGELLLRIGGGLALNYLVMDGHFGNNNALVMTRTSNLHLISKLRCDAKLFLPYTGAYSGHGPHRKYGDRLAYRALPAQYLKTTAVKGDIKTDIYQMQVHHKEFLPSPECRHHRQKPTSAPAPKPISVCFSSDLELAYDKLIDYYSLRFQIEFNFRDAKQFWGLEDFMNTKETNVLNAANLSLFMVNFTHCLLRQFRQDTAPDSSVLDLKAFYRGLRYVEETLKSLPQMPEPILFTEIRSNVTRLGRIHPVQTQAVSP